MKLLKLTWMGIKERPIYINLGHIVYIAAGFDGTTEITTIASGDKARVAVAETPTQVLELIELLESGQGAGHGTARLIEG
jgi:hypothetical protein